MKHNLEKLFEKIMWRIGEEQRFAAKRRLVFISLGAIASLAALVPVFNLARTDLAESGFLQFLSLAISNFGTVVVYWKTFIMSLLETIPAVSMAMLLGVVLVFLASLKLLAKDLKIVYGY
ncbi:MAG: hypothetical protein NTX55_00025 [Candidatus Parcubacteria bacterium]|nr:hypothetical protein [Candidatus Parcubacteria bacterium]